MDIYTGIDIVENSRIERAVRKHGDRFLNRIFTPQELEYCKGKAGFIPCLAGRFAVKEAFIKAFFQATGKKLSYRRIEVIGKGGRPAEILLHLPDAGGERLENRIKYSFSLSHEKNYSVAVAVVYLD
ncbi:MAG: holo-[acyl-carrier-protein] synthase [Aquificae bacterium]|nr:holo-[acyl-carrier-protein] synthase [Aquificota bacterium]